MALLKNIEWSDSSKNIIVYKYPMRNDYVSRGSALTVREGQNVVFSHKGQLGDVFLPGFYKLDTDSIPFITKIMSWKYGFENPFRSDVFFVNTTQFPNQKWGTVNPIIVRDKDFGAIRVRGYGTYSFRVKDPFVFLQQLSGTNTNYTSTEITDYLRSLLIMGITDAIGESKIPILDMAANVMELGKIVRVSLQTKFDLLGIEIVQFNIENLSMPEELEKALDKSASMGILRGNMDIYMQQAQAEALKEAAKNPGMAGTTLGAGLGLGMGKAFGEMMTPGTHTSQVGKDNAQKCSTCQKDLPVNAKFCSSCGTATGIICPKCSSVSKPGAKFCGQCGLSFTKTCEKCSVELAPGAKFCPSCGKET